MDDALSRLLWALPLVLLVGVAAIFVLKRWQAVVGTRQQAVQPLVLRQSLALSEHASVHLLDVEGRRVLVVESAHALGTIELGAAFARPGPRAARVRGGS